VENWFGVCATKIRIVFEKTKCQAKKNTLPLAITPQNNP